MHYDIENKGEIGVSEDISSFKELHNILMLYLK